MHPLPCCESSCELLFASLQSRSLSPTGDRIVVQHDEHALSAIFHRRQPRDVGRELRASHPEIEFAIDIGHRRFEARETHLSYNFAHSMYQRDASDLRHRALTRFFDLHLAPKEVAVGYIAADFLFSREQRFEFQLFNALGRHEYSAFAPLDLLEHYVVAQSFERCRDLGLFSFARQVADTLDVLQKVFPDGRDGLAHALIWIGNG